MTRPLLLAITLAACSRAATPAPRATPRPSTPPELTRAAAEHEEREIMERAANLSRYPGTDEGATAFALELARAAIANDRTRVERAMTELRADDTRFELALSFEGARALRSRVLPAVAAGADEVSARLATLREPLSVQIHSALGHELTASDSHGLDPRVMSVQPRLRPMVRFYRVEVIGADGSGAVTLEPMAWLAARWTWLGPLWSASTPAPATPDTPSARSAR